MSSSISASTTTSETSSYQNLRISGLASGLDTEAIIEKLMEAEEAKVFKIEQEKTLAEWRQEAYREIIGLVRDFMDSQFSLTDSEKSILSTSGYKSVSVSGASGAAVIIANGDAANGTYVINAIDQLACASITCSDGKCVGRIAGSADLSSGVIALEGTSFKLRLDGVQATISFDSDYEDLSGLTADLQAKVDDAFGAGRVTIGSIDGKLTLSASNSTLQVLANSEGTDALPTLGIASGAQNVVNLNASAAEVFGTAEDIAFAINGVSFSFSAGDSIASILSAVNRSSAGVTLSYSSLSDGFTLRSNRTGSASEIVIANTSGNLFGAGGAFKIDTGVVRNGKDAVFYLNDADLSDPIVRSENVFTIDGVTFSLKRETSDAVSYEVYDDVDAAKAKIQSFIDAYNGLLTKIADIIGEERDYDYAPLSDAQKDEMSDDEIDKWEAKAKKGILGSDALLTGLYNKMRNAFVSAIQGATTSFAQCGITTSLYTEKGQLVIDDAKLTAALEKDIGGVMELFSMSSDIGYSRDLTSGEAAERFNESGFAQRINDILKDYVTTTRNAAGYKGLLIEKAGLEGDTTEFSNAISKLIKNLEERIKEANQRKDDQEDRYWNQFSALEKAINTMNSQSQWISTMLGS